MRKTLYVTLLLGTMLVTGLNYPIGKIGIEHVSPLLLSGIRITLAGLVMLPFVWRLPHPKHVATWVKILIIALFQNVLTLGFIFVSMKTIPSSESSILSNLNPVWVVIVSTLFLHRKYRALQWGGVVLGFAGVCITEGFSLHLHIGTWIGGLSGLTWALATVLVHRWGSQINTWVLTAYQMLMGGPILLAASRLLEHPQLSVTHATWLPIILVLFWLIFFGSIGNFTAWFYLLKTGDAGKVSAFLFLAPLFSAGAGWLMLGETVQWNTAIGGLFIAISLFFVNWPAGGRRAMGKAHQLGAAVKVPSTTSL